MIPFGIGLGGAPGRYLIPRSLRFNSADSAYLSRTPGGAGNRKTWTFSAWIKLSDVGNNNRGIFDAYSADSDAGHFSIRKSGYSLQVYLWTTVLRSTTALFRDPSAWGHLVVAVDTTQAAAANRLRMYFNGSEIVAFSTSNDLSQNADTQVGNSALHRIGYDVGASAYSDMYLADAYLIDGQQLTPASFGMTDPATGQWVPIDASGISRGTTGFFLPFSDNSSTTTLGYDQGSGSNDWTLTNFSVASGAGNDSLTDTPTNNYCTLSPVNVYAGYQGRITNGMLDLDDNSLSGGRTGMGTFRPSSGKWYFEVRVDGILGQYPIWGWTNYDAGGSVFQNFDATGQKYVAGWVAYGAAFSNGDIAMCAIDFDAGKCWSGKNGTWYASGDPGAGTNEGSTFTAGTALSPTVSADSTTPVSCNFGQRPFSYTPPSGFLALCSENLTSDTVTASGTFTGNAAADGPFVFANGVGATLTLNGNAVTFGTHADKLANGFKLRTNSASYNASGSNTWAWTAGRPFRRGNAQGNP
jgi:hypothetical protein